MPSSTPGESYDKLESSQRRIDEYTQKEVPTGVISSPRNPVAWAALGHPLENHEDRAARTNTPTSLDRAKTPKSPDIPPAYPEENET